jgi:hypothetical protein
VHFTSHLRSGEHASGEKLRTFPRIDARDVHVRTGVSFSLISTSSQAHLHQREGEASRRQRIFCSANDRRKKGKMR